MRSILRGISVPLASLLYVLLITSSHFAPSHGATRRARTNKGRRSEEEQDQLAGDGSGPSECPFASSQRVEHVIDAGEHLLRQGLPADAQPCFQKVTRVQASNAHAWHGLANTQAALGDHAKAVLSFRKALRLKPNDEVAQVNLGNSLKSLGEIDKAANAYQNAVRLAPDYGPAYYNLAGLRQVQGRPDAAVELYQETIRLQPTLPEAYFALGKLCHAESRMHEAILAYQSVLQLDLPNHLRAQANVKGAEVLAREGREAEAMAMLDAAVSAAPDFPAPFAARAAVAIQQGDYATAARGFNQALSLATDPEQQRHFRLQATIAAAQAHMEAGRPGAAIKLYEELLAEHPRNPQLHLALGTACSTAAAQLSSASPGEGEVSSAARAEHAAREERLFERATEAFQFALKLQPNHAPTYRNIGRLLRAQREYNGALAAFKRAVKLVPDAASWCAAPRPPLPRCLPLPTRPTAPLPPLPPAPAAPRPPLPRCLRCPPFPRYPRCPAALHLTSWALCFGAP
ncbi:hypothetical protein CYMTET_37302 [Cymbomonas tetramitiformis]|uniref:Uncharacterized protein n=1 Tax=Cymbomonas tetramitiformis TaxID=36881 RepID=A0AAE0F6D0_9CHLO|nr:hypothetical protein CYMTET_37302 [Cymbomonas tetramitiformis]